MNSPYKYKCEDYLHYVDWSECKNSPKIFKMKDLSALKNSNKLMARKFDIEVDFKIVNAIKNII